MTPSQEELDSLAAAFSETQDQMLAIFGLSQKAMRNFDTQKILSFIAEQSCQILGAQDVFLAVISQDEVINFIGFPEGCFDPQELVPSLQKHQVVGKSVVTIPVNQADVLYVIIREIRGKAQLIMGFRIDTPEDALNPILNLADAIANQAQVQVSNAILHEELLTHAKLQAEMEAAQQMQASLLPVEIPDLSNIELEVAVHFKPVFMVGGDFYDFRIRTDRWVDFVVGDISGKGFSAALLMTMTLNTIRNGFRFLPNPTPEKILTRVNRDMYVDYSRAGVFATVFLGSYDTESHQIVFGNAGHSPVIYCPVGESAYLLEADGPGIGVLQESLSKTHTLNVSTGDVLIICTDGFNEAINRNREMFGIDRLLRLTESLRNESTEIIKNEIIAQTSKFASGQPQSDDQTIIVIKVKDFQ